MCFDGLDYISIPMFHHTYTLGKLTSCDNSIKWRTDTKNIKDTIDNLKEHLTFISNLK